ncbi:extracellular solute-binding protein [Treponema sp.]
MLTFLSCGVKIRKSNIQSRVVFLHYFSGSLSGGIDDLVKKFNFVNPTMYLSSTPIDHESYKTSMVDTLLAGNPPDLYSSWAGAKTKELIDSLEPLDELWLDSKLDEVFPKALVESASIYSGKRYLVPLTQHVVGFFYNKRAFERAGVEVPSDWDSFLEVCKRLKEEGLVPIALGAKDKWPAQFWFDYLLIRTAGFEYRKALLDGRRSWTDPEVKKVFALWRQLLDAGFFNSGSDSIAWDEGAGRMLAQGDAAMILMGSWIMGSWKEQGFTMEDEKDFSFFPFPIIKHGVPSCVLGPIDGVVIPKGAKNIEGAKEVLRFLVGKEAQETMSRGSGGLAPAPMVAPSTPTKLRIQDLVNSAETWAFNYDLDTKPEASLIGLSLFVDFLRFPHHADALLEAAQKQFARIHSRTP